MPIADPGDSADTVDKPDRSRIYGGEMRRPLPGERGQEALDFVALVMWRLPELSMCKERV